MKIAFVIAFCMALSGVWAQTNTKVVGKLQDLEAGTVVYFYPNKAYEKRDSLIAGKGGKFEFNLALEEGDIYWLRIGKGQSPGDYSDAYFYLEPGLMKIKGKVSALRQAALSGSKFADEQNQLGKYIKNAKELKDAKATAIGKPAPDFVQNDPSGKPVALKDFRGKYVLVDFWASWCGPCRKENPNLVKAYNNLKDKNFTVLGVSLDLPNGKEKWLKAIQDDQLPWTQVSDLHGWNNAVAKLYDIHAAPSNLLIGPDGVILAKNLRGENFEEHLKTYIK